MKKVKVILPKHIVKTYEEVAKELASAYGWEIERINKKSGETYFKDLSGVQCVWYRGDEAYECDKDGIVVSDNPRHSYAIEEDLDSVGCIVWGENEEGEIVAVIV